MYSLILNALFLVCALLFYNTTYTQPESLSNQLFMETSQKKSPLPALTDGKMHIYFCGTGIPEPVAQNIRRPACLAIIADKQFILFDAGEGAIETIAGMGLPFTKIYHVFITHWHSDHFAGLGYLINASWTSGRNQPITVSGPAGIKPVMTGIDQTYQLDVKFRSENQKNLPQAAFAFANVQEITPKQYGKVLYQTKTWNVTPFSVDHRPVEPALGYLIHYKGCNVVISGDTRIVPSLAENSRNADVLINEAFSHALYIKHGMHHNAVMDPIKRYHSDTLELAKMAQADHVKYLVLTHLIPSIPTTTAAKKAFIAGMNEFYHGTILVADDQDEIVLSSLEKGCQVQYIPNPPP